MILPFPMKIAGRTLILIFLLVFAMQEVRGDNFFSGGIYKSRYTAALSGGHSFQGQHTGDGVNTWLFYPAEENDEPAGQHSCDRCSAFTKELSYLFEGLVGSDAPRPEPDLHRASIVTSAVTAPRYILYHSLRIPAA